MKKLTIILTIIAAILTSCDLKPDVAPMPNFIGEANTTIAELVAMHTIRDEDSYDSIPMGSNIIICGRVVTSDQWGNNYKYINIEDETGGIQIKIDNKALYNKYRVGQRVYVKCDGLILGDYRKLPQLGFWANGSVQPIPSFKTYLYLFPDGSPMGGGNPKDMTTIPNANSIPNHEYNCWVRLVGAKFKEGGLATFSELSGSTSHDIEMQDGTTITMRTSNYATFAQDILPMGTGEITGILTRYNNTVQIVISSLADLDHFSAPVQRQTIFSVNYNNAFNEGWFQTGTGNDWQTLVNSSFSGFFATQGENQDKWLVSPAIALNNCTEPELSFTHRATRGFEPTAMTCYYTTNFTGDVTTTTWIPVNITTDPGVSSSTSFLTTLPESAQSPGFRLAFRLTEAQSPWYISDIKITGLVR